MTGRGLSQLCFGCEPLGGTDWGTVDIAEIGRAIDRALDLGIDFFDTADVYGLGLSEERLSQALGQRRHDVVIATKGGVSWSGSTPLTRATVTYDSSPKYLRTAVENSLRRLRLDVLPIYYVHWPDPKTPIETTFSVLEKLRAEGKIRSLGCSNYSADQVARACQAATVEYVQLPINVLEGAPESEMVEVCTRHQLRIVAYNVLAQGLLTGKYTESSRFPPDDRRSRVPLFQGQRYRDALARAAQIREEAVSEKLTPAQYAIRWVLRQPRVASAIVGVKSVKQLDENAVGVGAAVVGSTMRRMTVLDLGDLADPAKYHGPIEISGEDPEFLRGQLRKMLCIRLVEQQLARARKEGIIGGPVHLGVGQEAIAVGVSACLRSSDRVFGAHRSHSHVLALGSDVRALFAEVLGKDTGLSRGMGGSMHLWDGPRGFYGSVPIVAGTVPLAVGAALAAKLKGVDDVGVSYLGDGAVEEGSVQESFNLARVLGVPVLFVVENNFFSSHMHIGLRQPSNATARFAQAHDIPCAIVDGNDVVAVNKAARQLVEHARAGKGPGFLEAVTYRWLGHVDWREDIDVGVNRSIEELKNWRGRDPVGRLAAALEHAGAWSPARHTKLVEELDAEIKLAWDRAMADPWPKPEALLDRVYAHGAERHP